MRALLAALLVATALAGCTETDSEATLIIEFSGQNRGVHDLETKVHFDETARPSLGDYDGRAMGHPDDYTVHDLLVDWNGAHAVTFSYFDGLGYTLDSLFGVHSDFQDACWFWSILVNGEAAQTGISTTPVEDGDEVTFRYTNCWAQPSQSILHLDFDGVRPNIEIDLAYDAASAPSAAEYDDQSTPHAGFFTVHDLMTRWGGYDQVNLTHFDGLGFAVQGILGVEGTFDDETCRFWALNINGVDSDVGMSGAQVEDGDLVTWTYTSC